MLTDNHTIAEASLRRSRSASGATLRRASQGDEYVYRYKVDPTLSEEIKKFAEEKKKLTMCDSDEDAWRDSIKRQMEAELDRRVREALETPNAQKSHKGALLRDAEAEAPRDMDSLEQLNSHIDLSTRDRELVQQKRWKVLQAKRKLHQFMSQGLAYGSYDECQSQDMAKDLESLRQEEYENLLNSFNQNAPENDGSGSQCHKSRSQDFYTRLNNKVVSDYANLTNSEKLEFFYSFTKNGFREALRTGRLPDGTEVDISDGGRFTDKFGVVRDQHGPFWPADYGPMFPAPGHRTEDATKKPSSEPLVDPDKIEKYPTTETNPQNLKYPGRWRGVQIVYDSEKSCRDYVPRAVPEGLAPSLAFESRFECGNLRQARRIGAFEYELVLKTDLYTTRHTQWFYFRVLGAVPGVTYKFKIINFHKRDSLYNHGMRPLLYSEKRATSKNVGWERVGHHISYARNTCNLQCPLLARDRSYYTLEWQMEFTSSEDTHYLAHCYPYTFTDLRDDLDTLLNDPERSKVMKRQVMCETRAGNSCFLITVTNFETNEHRHKKAVVVSARVHPGETNSSWMMKGVLQHITGSSQAAKELRDKFIFKIIPMLNPDGVIVGNYRCSLAGRDLNRNYRHPRKESFPTVWYTKAMMEEVSHWNDILVYCDLHGHSRKHNVFMYGCNMEANVPLNHQGSAPVNPENYIQERLFPWLMSQKAPDKFWFRGCKFQVKRSKESTGRVVMFKQMKIANSFTMEATFCGTTICRGEKRHFNTLDYQEMGRVFCEVVLDYQDVNENKSRQSEVILELTRAITQQILESRGLLSAELPDFTTELGREQLKTFPRDEVSSSEQIASAFISMVMKDHSAANQGQKQDLPNNTKENPPDMDKMDIHELLDTMSSQTIDGCAQLLEQLHVADTVGESDSSDSDSESEPEMKYSDPKARRRKKKKKKGRGSVQEGAPGSADKSKGLPAIDTESQKRRKQGSAFGSNSKMVVKSYPAYVNRYSGRSNGGIPCFSQERLMERASKRMQDMKKRTGDDPHRRESIISIDDEVPSSLQSGDSGPLLHRMRTHTELRRQFQQVLQQPVYPGGSHHIRMGYMHAAPGHEGGATDPAGQLDDDSSSEGSLEFDDLPHRLPLAAMRTPYQNILNPPSSGQPIVHPLQRRLGRLPWLPSLTHKTHVVDSCSIPLRHSMATNPGSGKAEKMESTMPSHGPLSIDTVGTHLAVNRNINHRKTGSRSDVQSLDSVSGPQGSLGLMSREYTELLLNRLRTNKAKGPSGQSFSSTAMSKLGERHSTCE